MNNSYCAEHNRITYINALCYKSIYVCFFLKVACPNITGEINPVAYNADGSGGYYLGCDSSGAFSPVSDNNSVFRPSTLNYISGKKAGGKFDASRSSSIYGKSPTVQPSALSLNYVIKA